ncbi:MAG: orotate phosphoribosyltransferase [Nitrososphaerales archaeon]
MGAGSYSEKLQPEDTVGETSPLTSGTLAGKAALAEALFRIGALRFGKFTLSSGKRSSYYLDLRMIPSYPEVYALAIEAYREIAEGVGEKNFDVIAGVATAGVTISSPLAFLLKKPMVYVRKEEKGHGLGRQVEGATRPGQKTLVIDDLVTTGGSIISAVEALRKTGCAVKEAAVLVDRLEGGKANLAGAGVRLNAYAQVTELIEILYQGRMMTKGDYEAVVKQVRGGTA